MNDEIIGYAIIPLTLGDDVLIFKKFTTRDEAYEWAESHLYGAYRTVPIIPTPKKKQQAYF